MSAEQRIDADTLGRVAHEALVEQLGRMGWQGAPCWADVDDDSQRGLVSVAQAVARVVLSAAVAHLRRDLEWTRGRTRGETVRHVLDGYEDAIDELTTYAKQAGLEAPE